MFVVAVDCILYDFNTELFVYYNHLYTLTWNSTTVIQWDLHLSVWHTGVLVIQDKVWPPHQAAGDVDHFKSIIVLFIPLQVSIMPCLPDPQVGNQHLVPLILHTHTHTPLYIHTSSLNIGRLNLLLISLLLITSLGIMCTDIPQLKSRTCLSISGGWAEWLGNEGGWWACCYCCQSFTEALNQRKHNHFG